ncbi:hypothetical protein O7635_37880 [Asanoa sp. WMMD1127]|uniref:hypothetical protein n=1 Tax=Asanoa sp. WMMD1127 TaxID=3016107 RepID=UPI002415D1DF|nr:hypothetical protein [Asanoa sp. WMMD1127]MDG4827645.1 hypothetical protein [Asanoa sp. WMMD1127]
MRLRRQLAVLAVSAALVAVAGCSGDVEGRGDAAGTPGASASASTPSAAASPSVGAPGASAAPQLSLGPEPTAKAGGNATKICADAKQASEKGTTAFVQQLTAVLEAQGRKDKNAEQAAERKLGQVLDAWAADLRKASSGATDAQLKTTLTQLAGQVDGLTSDVETIDDAALSAIQDRLDTLCPN